MFKLDTVLFRVCESEGMKQWFFRVVGQWTYQINLVNQFGTADVVVCGCQVLRGRGQVWHTTHPVKVYWVCHPLNLGNGSSCDALSSTYYMFRRPCICESFLGQDPVLCSSLWVNSRAHCNTHVWGYPRVTLCAQLLLCDLSLPWKSGFKSCICNLHFLWQDPVGKSPRAMFTIICTLKPVLMTENMLATCTSCALCTLMINSMCLGG